MPTGAPPDRNQFQQALLERLEPNFERAEYRADTRRRAASTRARNSVRSNVTKSPPLQ